MLQSILIQLSDLSTNQQRLSAKLDALTGSTGTPIVPSPANSPPSRPQSASINSALAGLVPSTALPTSDSDSKGHARPSITSLEGHSSGSRANFLEWARTQSNTPAAQLDKDTTVPAPQVAPASPYPQRIILTSTFQTPQPSNF